MGDWFRQAHWASFGLLVLMAPASAQTSTQSYARACLCFLHLGAGWPINEVNCRLHEEVSRLEIGLLSWRYQRTSEVLPCLEDYMTVEFNSAKNGAGLQYVFDQVIALYIRSFGAFFAAVEDMDVQVEEEDEFWKSSNEERMQVRAQSGPR